MVLKLHGQDEHGYALKMQASLQCDSCFIVQYVREPIVVHEDQFAGEEYAIWEISFDAFRHFSQFFNGISAVSVVRGGGQAIFVAKIDVKAE